MKPKSISYSSLEIYGKCPLRFKLKYIERLKSTTLKTGQDYFERGKKVHSAFADMIECDKYGKSIDDSCRESLGDSLFDRAKNDFLKSIASDVQRKNRNLEIEVFGSEAKIIAEYLEMLLVGYVDFAFRNRRSGVVTIIELKTGKKKLEYELQKSMYVLIGEQYFNSTIKLMSVYYDTQSIEESFPLPTLAKEKINEVIYDESYIAKPGNQCSFCEYRSGCKFSK